MSMKFKLLVFFAVIAIFGVIALYVHEFQWFQNYIKPQKMVLGSLLVGLAVGIMLAFRFQKKEKDLVDKIQIWTVCIVTSILPMPLLASLANRFFAEQKPHETPVEFWEEKAHLVGRSPTIYGFIEGNKKTEMGYFIFVIIDGELVRVKSKTPRFSNSVQGDTIVVPIKKGLFNVDYIEWQD
ncbi:MAG: hypothetical protein GC192_00990 [Bacteroidetes bacterium]|nr:hypothetical protein [Bacteroidota bacterium]